ncbi:MAG: stage II sporulation protein R [Bacilli bacterium]
MKKIIIVLTIITTALIYNAIKDQEIIIPDTSIRLRVIPNSNSILDQNMKNKVKKYLEKNTYTLLENVNDISTARKIINDNVSDLDTAISDIFKENNYNMKYDINFGYNYFPEKEYRKVKYKEGYYESIVITIGEGEGDNWWCILFPNLCLVDLENISDVEYKSWIEEKINKIF